MLLSTLVVLTSLVARLQGETCIDADPSAFEWTGQNHKLKLNGVEFHMKGVAWFGFDSTMFVVHGLQYHSIDWYLTFLKNNGFNALRIPFSRQMFVTNPTLTAGAVAGESGLNGGSKSLAALDLLITKAAAKGILIMLDLHSWNANSYTEGLYTAGSLSDKVSLWRDVAQRYKSRWNVFMADLFNEPHDVSGDNWSSWINYCQDAGNALIDEGVNWLFAVQGTDSNCPYGGCATNWCNWGENLVQLECGAKKYVVLNEANRVVYTPHVYGPSIGGNPFGESNWVQRWGFIASSSTIGAPVILGEFGTKYERADDKQWLSELVTYLKKIGQQNTFFWCLNYDSGDTHGLVKSDWTSPETEKLAILDDLQPNPTVLTYKSSTNQVCGSIGSGSPTTPTYKSPTKRPTPKPTVKPVDGKSLTVEVYSATQQYWLEFNVNNVGSSISSVAVKDGGSYTSWYSGTYNSDWKKWVFNNNGNAFSLPLSVRVITSDGYTWILTNVITSFGAGSYTAVATAPFAEEEGTSGHVAFGDFKNYTAGNWVVFFVIIIAIIVIILGITCFIVKKKIKSNDNKAKDDKYVSLNNGTNQL